MDSLISLYNTKPTISYLSILGIILISFIISINIINSVFKHPLKYPKLIPKLQRIHPILYAATGGLFGGFTTLFTKSASTIVSGLFTKEFEAFLHVESYVLIIAMVLSLFLQVFIILFSIDYID